MSSLNRHLVAGPEHDALSPHPECPRCCALCDGRPLPADTLAGQVTAAAVLALTTLGALGAPVAAVAAGGVSVKPVAVVAAGTPEPVDGAEEADDPDVEIADEPPNPALVDDAAAPSTPSATPGPGSTAIVEPTAPVSSSPQASAPVTAEPTPSSTATAAPAPVAVSAPAPEPVSAAPPAAALLPATPTPPPVVGAAPFAAARESGPQLRRPVPASRGAPTPMVAGTTDVPTARRSSRATTSGARTAAPAFRAPSAVGGDRHEIAAGECLWSIARARLGAAASTAAVARYVDALWNVNAGHLATSDPDVIPVGAVITLPSASLATRIR